MESLPVIRDILRLYEEGKSTRDPRTKNWLLLEDNPVYVWILTAMYLTFVFVGPKVMKNRKPFHFQTFMVVYNLGLVALSTYMFVEIIYSCYDIGYYKEPLCAPYNKETIKNPKELRLAKVFWWYFFSKALEFMDTIMMILRKKNNQVTFLHVFHHISMLNFWWWVMVYVPGGQSWFSSSLNCSVHIVMYLYYALSAIPSLREKLWWKKYITKFQLSQFVLTFIHVVQSIVSGCDFPLWGQFMLALYMIILLGLFGNFYLQTYIKKRQGLAKKTDERYSNGIKNGSISNEINGHAEPIRNGNDNGYTKIKAH